jgi:prephenate dehydrogenase
MKKILLVGGNGGMGKMFQHFLSRKSGYQISIFEKEDWQDPSVLTDQDIVLITTPIHLTENIIAEVCPYLSNNTILADFTSVKQTPLSCMLKYHQGPVVGLHPIFGPLIESADEQVIVCCEGRYPEKYNWFIEDIANIGFEIALMTAKEHDEAMDFIQGIEHFSTYCLGKFLQEKKVDIDSLMKISSPNYKYELNIVGRLFNQKPELYADIIMSDEERIKTINDFVKSIQVQNKDIQNQSREKFIQDFESIKKWMGDFTEKAYTESNNILNKK